jgi:predicted RNase H-like nuclease (RuvC/YqgF family)
MKAYAILGTLLLACVSMLAQSGTPAQTGGQSKEMPSNMKMESVQKAEGMPEMKSHMAEMQADMQQMKSRVEKMKAEAEKVKDENTKAALLDNADMWEQFINRMQSHMEMMMKGGGMHQHHEGMMPGKGMKHGQKPTSPPAGQPPAPTPK